MEFPKIPNLLVANFNWIISITKLWFCTVHKQKSKIHIPHLILFTSPKVIYVNFFNKSFSIFKIFAIPPYLRIEDICSSFSIHSFNDWIGESFEMIWQHKLDVKVPNYYELHKFNECILDFQLFVVPKKNSKKKN